MRHVLLATSYPTQPGDPSGHFVRAEARLLAAQGHEVHVVAPAPWAHDRGVTAHACGGASLFAWPGSISRMRSNPTRLLAVGPFGLHALRHLAALRPDHLTAHWALPCGWPLGTLARPRSLGLVCHGADVRLLLAMPPPLRALIAQELRLADEIRFVATSLRDALLGSLPARLAAELERRSRVQPPCVQVDEREAPGGPAPGRHALVASRLVASKRVHLAIEALEHAPSWSLRIAGDGPERPSLERLARRIAPGRVDFLGLLSRQQTLGRMEQASALLHPSSHEAAPTAILESLALGVPVIACDAGDVALWSQREPLLRVVSPDARSLAQALRLLDARSSAEG